MGLLQRITGRVFDPWLGIAKPHWMAQSKLAPPATPGEVLQASELVGKFPMFFGDFIERGDYDGLIRYVRGESPTPPTGAASGGEGH